MLDGWEVCSQAIIPSLLVTSSCLKISLDSSGSVTIFNGIFSQQVHQMGIFRKTMSNVYIMWIFYMCWNPHDRFLRYFVNKLIAPYLFIIFYYFRSRDWLEPYNYHLQPSYMCLPPNWPSHQKILDLLLLYSHRISHQLFPPCLPHHL